MSKYIYSYDKYLNTYIDNYNEKATKKIKRYVSLSVCQSDNSYSVLLIQPRANLKVEKAKGLIPEEYDKFIEKFRKYIELAYKKKYDLILTPEYSVPIQIIKELVQNQEKLKSGSLYCMCCESIAYNEFTTLLNEFKEVNNVDVCFDALNEINENELVCCLLYITKIKFIKENSETEEKLFLIPQFKTTHMKDKEMNFETSSLSCGKVVFYFGKEDEVKFLSLICADVFDFDLINNIKTLAGKTKVNIFNPQLNPKPQNELFRFMRSMLIGFTPKDSVRIIALNWALGTSFIIDKMYGKPFDYSWSAVYDEYNNNEFNNYLDVLDKNVSYGLDFAHNNSIAVWFFPNDEHVMDLNLKHSVTARGPVYVQEMQPITINKYLIFDYKDKEYIEDNKFCFRMIDSFFRDNKEFSGLISCENCENNNKVCTKSKLDKFVASIFMQPVELEYMTKEGEISTVSSKHYKSKYSRAKLYMCKRVHEKLKNKDVTEKFKCLKPEFRYILHLNGNDLYNLKYFDDDCNKDINSRIVYLQYAKRAEAEKVYSSFYDKNPNFAENLMIYYEDEHGVFVFPDSEFTNTKVIAGEVLPSNTSII